jgi:serine/threonine protein kinase
MGIVWLAHDEYLHRDVAIKEIQPRGREIRDSDPEVRRTLREARAAAKLSEHPGIITVHDVVTDERGLPWIVMQLLSGRSLGETLDLDGPMPVNQAAAISVQVLQALEYAHANGVLHRDVKPGNVMLVGDKVVLTDFGIAVIDGASALTATGQIPGAPEYIAPERILGEEALPSADLWSVGITLYGMVVGQTPFHRTDIQATLAAALSQEPDSHPSVGRLWPVIQGLLRKKPAERWTARQAIDKLTEIAALPAPAPDTTRARLEYPTKDEDPAGAITVIDDTTPNTRTQPPPLPPLITRARPDDPTLDPFPMPRKPRSKHGLLIAAGIVFTVGAIVAAVILVSQWLSDWNPGGSPTTTRQTTAGLAPVSLKSYPEPDLGFHIGIPPDWQREPSSDGPVRYVAWKGKEDDPKVGTLNVRVLRDTSRPGVSALTYLSDEAKTQGESQDNVDFQKIVLEDNGGSAILEYTHRTAAGSTRFHTWVQAFSRGTTVYTLTFSLFANDESTLRKQWQDAEQLVAQIRNSFRLS